MMSILTADELPLTSHASSLFQPKSALAAELKT